MSNSMQSLPSSGPVREEHKVTTERDAATGTVTYEEWWKDGKLDRADGPAYIVRDAATGTVTREAWWKDGKLDRADGPAAIERDAATGTVTGEAWCKDGKLDRADGPAYIERDAATGIVTYEAWYKDGKAIAPPSPVAAMQDEISSLAAEFKAAVTAFGERLEALAPIIGKRELTPDPSLDFGGYLGDFAQQQSAPPAAAAPAPAPG